ncbi:MAG: Dabb family protein [Bacteroidaceae bacterium]|nr:Dabb family protein [Bacteroidaceae bacterium]
MVKHIVLFKLKNEIPAAEKQAVALKFKSAIENLPSVIPFIIHVEVGVNINPDEQWDIALYSEFNTLEEVKAYAFHPAHVAAAKLLAEVKESRSCVDYETNE